MDRQGAGHELRIVSEPCCHPTLCPNPGMEIFHKKVSLGAESCHGAFAGVLPVNLVDQEAAQRLAMCNDIGEASYEATLIAAALLETVRRLECGHGVLNTVHLRYGLHMRPDMTGPRLSLCVSVDNTTRVILMLMCTIGKVVRHVEGK